MTRLTIRALLAVLFVLCVGLMLAICAVQVCYLVTVDKAYRNVLYGRVFGKQKLWDGIG